MKFQILDLLTSVTHDCKEPVEDDELLDEDASNVATKSLVKPEMLERTTIDDMTAVYIAAR